MQPGRADYTTIVKVLAALIAKRVPGHLDKLYGSRAYAPDMIEPAKKISGSPIKVIIGGIATSFEFGLRQAQASRIGNAECGIVEDTEQLEVGMGNAEFGIFEGTEKRQVSPVPDSETSDQRPVTNDQRPETDNPISELVETADRIARGTAEAHHKFLELSEEVTRSYAEAFNLHTKLLERALQESDNSIPTAISDTTDPDLPHSPIPSSNFPHSRPVFSRQQ